MKASMRSNHAPQGQRLGCLLGPHRVRQRVRQHARRPGPRGFSLTELLVVLAIITLLVAIIVIATKKVHRMSNMSGDLNNQRQIALALSSYSLDFNGALPSNRTSTDGNFNYLLNPSGGCGGPFQITINEGNTNAATYHSWTASYGTNMFGSEEVEYGLNTSNIADSNRKALSSGKLWPYIGDYGVYRSPLDPSAWVSGQTYQNSNSRIRSYSLNGFVGSTVPEDSNEWANKWDDWFCANGVPMTATNTTKISRIPQPARTIASIVEDDFDGFNFNNQGWVVDPRRPNTGSWSGSPTSGWEGWIDWPAMWDPTAIPFSYMDGSTEVYSLVRLSEDDNLPEELVIFGHRYAQPPDDNGVQNDWLYFRDRLLPGIVPSLSNRSFGY
ncbi:MAG: type II secretion system protein [Planctomycetota bacterium]|nr:type II secretion system protein [Planctomycetota bacterium]